jgi:predicted aspartyl protease
MGRIVTRVEVKNPLEEGKGRIFDALVDTGASMLTMPLAWRTELGALQQTRKSRVQLADQATQEVEIAGPVSIEIEGFPKIYGEVMFLEMKPTQGRFEPLLGYIPLEQAGIVVDMVGHRLKTVEHMDLK